MNGSVYLDSGEGLKLIGTGPKISYEISSDDHDIPKEGVTLGCRMSVSGKMTACYINHELLDRLAAEQRYYAEVKGVHLVKVPIKKPLPRRSGSARGNARRTKAKMACRPQRHPYVLRIDGLTREDIWPKEVPS